MSIPTPPWQPEQAIAFAQVANTVNFSAANMTSWHNECGKFCANAYGFGGSGYNTALLQAQASRLNGGQAPLGALHFWGGGDGHVAIEAGFGKIWSNDLAVDGQINLSPFGDVSTKWGKPYLGWAHPTAHDTFMQAWGTNLWGYDPPALTPAPPPQPTGVYTAPAGGTERDVTSGGGFLFAPGEFTELTLFSDNTLYGKPDAELRVVTWDALGPHVESAAVTSKGMTKLGIASTVYAITITRSDAGGFPVYARVS